MYKTLLSPAHRLCLQCMLQLSDRSSKSYANISLLNFGDIPETYAFSVTRP